MAEFAAPSAMNDGIDTAEAAVDRLMAEFAAPSAMNDRARLWLSTPTSGRATPGRAPHSLEHATPERDQLTGRGCGWSGTALATAVAAESGCG